MGISVSKAVLLAAGLVVGAGSAQAAVKRAPARVAPVWIITPTDEACHADLELAGRSGTVAEVSLESDGEHIVLRFAREEVPQRAFLPIRIDQRPYANLVQRAENGAAIMTLSEETVAALRRGSTLQIAWLAAEPLAASLAGSEQGLVDLRICGVQVAGQRRARELAREAQQIRAEADARAKALSDEQLAAAKAQTAAAEAERRRVAAETSRLAAETDRLAAEAQRQRALAQAEAHRRQQQAFATRYEEDYQPQQRWSPYRDPAPYRGRGGYDDDYYN